LIVSLSNKSLITVKISKPITLLYWHINSRAYFRYFRSSFFVLFPLTRSAKGNLIHIEKEIKTSKNHQSYFVRISGKQHHLWPVSCLFSHSQVFFVLILVFRLSGTKVKGRLIDSRPVNDIRILLFRPTTAHQ